MRFLLNQKAFTADDKVLYELILEEDYTEGLKPSDASEALADKTPTNTALGSTALYITFIDGKRIQWKFEYQQTAVDEEGWVIVEVLDGGVAPIPLEVTENATYEGNGATGYTPVEVEVPLPEGKITITENGEDIDIAQYATADVNVSGGSVEFINVTVNNAYNSEDFEFPCYARVPEVDVYRLFIRRVRNGDPYSDGWLPKTYGEYAVIDNNVIEGAGWSVVDADSSGIEIVTDDTSDYYGNYLVSNNAVITVTWIG